MKLVRGQKNVWQILVTHQTGPKGKKVKVYIQEAYDIEKILFVLFGRQREF